MKPGYLTTEFFLTLVVTIAGCLPASGLLPVDHWAIKVAGLVVAVAAAMGYTVSRTAIKTSATSTQAESQK